MFDTLSRYILKRTALRFLLLFVVFMGVLVGGQIALLLGRGVPPEACLPMIQALGLLSVPIALPVALASAILVVIGGMVQDGEFRALASSGVGHRRVLVRLVPLLIVIMAGSAILTHVIMPMGMADLRANKGRLAKTAIASMVAEGDSIYDDKGLSVWAGAADGSRLEDVRALMVRGNEFIAMYSPVSRWVIAEEGIHLECDDVQMLVRQPGHHVMAMDTERYAYLLDNELTRRDRIDPDTLPTTTVLKLASTPPDPKDKNGNSVYNNARLTLHFRFFLPLSLIAFALLAMGLGLTFGTDQNLFGVLIIVVVVAAVVYPAFGYVKTKTNLPQIDPGWILWPPALVVAVFGAWMSWNPDRAREVLRAPLDWWATRRVGRA
jgi:lipopolysaccharide export LptBFGC system permease protein LptF